MGAPPLFSDLLPDLTLPVLPPGWTEITPPDWLAAPLAVVVVISALLWSGRIRQTVVVNFLVLGMMLPALNLFLFGMAFHLSHGYMTQQLVELLPPWLS